MPYTPITATLGYVLSPCHQKVLMVHRNAREQDFHLGKYNGLGGKLESHEDPYTGMRRELLEEAAIDVQSMQLRGVINWPGFGKSGEDWLGFIFLITQFSGEVPTHNAEGSLHWIPRNQLLQLPLWDGDRHFLPLVFDDDAGIFFGLMPYQKGKMQSWTFQR
jgi:8-oxo-dGTP diphosphatase